MPMDLERTAATIRPRGTWEGIDLGFALARAWFLPLWTLWWLTAAPVALLGLIWLHDMPSLWWLLVWWLKPLYEALLVAWLGRALFGDRLTLVQSARLLPATLGARIWPHLSWRRLSPIRALALPVTLLEHLGGRARRLRMQQLASASGAGWLTLICMHLEAVLWLSVVLVIVVLIPEQLPRPELGAMLWDEQSLAYWLSALAGLAAVSIIAPFYIAAGFALYVSRRTDLEAWDLELRFRSATRSSGSRRAQRWQPAPPRAAAVLVFGLLLAAPVDAADWPGNSRLSPAEAKAQIDEVLAGEDFGRTREREVWAYVGEMPDDPEPTQGLPPGLIGDLILFLAEAVKWLLLVAAAMLLALLARRVVLELAQGRGRRRRPGKDKPAPAVTEPLPGRLPDDVAGAVRALIAAGGMRAALALLYRAQIKHLRALGLHLPDGATEADCLAAAQRRVSPAELDWLRRLMRLWQRTAYARESIAAADVEHLLAGRPEPIS